MQARPRFLLSACLGLVLAGPMLAQDYSPPEPQWPLACKAEASFDLASLVPAHTLAYLELHQPDRLVEEVRELFKGSLLEDPGRIIARARRGEGNNSEQLALCTLFSPEVLDELASCKGGMVALTGFPGESPQIVAVLQTGKGRMVPLAVRVFLAGVDGVKSVGRVEGVTIYHVGEKKYTACCYRGGIGATGSAILGGTTSRPAQSVSYYHTPAEAGGGVFLAQLPEAIVAGSTKAAVADTIRRLKGKSKTPSLSDNKTFQEATSLRTAPGLFAYADAPRLYRLLRPSIRKQIAGDKQAAQQWKLLQAMLNPTAVRFVAGSWSLQKAECRSCVEVRTQEGQVIPALDWLTDQKLSKDLLRTVPGDAFFMLAMPISDRLRSLDFCESIDKLHGSFSLAFGMPAPAAEYLQKEDSSEASEMTGPSPDTKLSAREVEKRMEMHVGKDVLARIRTLAVTGGLHQAADHKEFSCTPVLLVEATSEEAARELEKLWPRLHSLGGPVSQPRPVKVRGDTLLCLSPKTGKDEKDHGAASALPSYYARTGKVLVLGWQAARVAASLRAPSEKRPMLNLPLAQATAQQDPAGLFLLFSGRQLLRQTCSLMGDDEAAIREIAHQLRHMSRAMKEVPPTVFLFKRDTNCYRCEMRQSDLKKAAAPVLNGLVRVLMSMEQPSGRYCVAPACPPAVPVPQTPNPGTLTAPAATPLSSESQSIKVITPNDGTSDSEDSPHWWDPRNRD